MELLRSNQLNRGVVHRFASAMRFILAEGCKNFKKLSRLTLEYLNSSYSISNCENHQLLFFAKISFGHKNMPFQVMLPIHNRIKYFLKWHFCSHKLGFSRNFPQCTLGVSPSLVSRYCEGYSFFIGYRTLDLKFQKARAKIEVVLSLPS